MKTYSILDGFETEQKALYPASRDSGCVKVSRGFCFVKFSSTDEATLRAVHDFELPPLLSQFVETATFRKLLFIFK